jgi:hypothetical protein
LFKARVIRHGDQKGPIRTRAMIVIGQHSGYPCFSKIDEFDAEEPRHFQKAIITVPERSIFVELTFDTDEKQYSSTEELETNFIAFLTTTFWV